MSHKEKPPAGVESNLDPNLSASESSSVETHGYDSTVPSESKPPLNVDLADEVSAEMVDVGDQNGPNEVPTASLAETHFAPSIPENLDNISANGGAVGAIVLGVWSLIGSFITGWSILNALLGLLLGVWGLSSRRRRWAWVGILFCLVSVFLCLIEASEWINRAMETTDESPI